MCVCGHPHDHPHGSCSTVVFNLVKVSYIRKTSWFWSKAEVQGHDILKILSVYAKFLKFLHIICIFCHFKNFRPLAPTWRSQLRYNLVKLFEQYIYRLLHNKLDFILIPICTPIFLWWILWKRVILFNTISARTLV